MIPDLLLALASVAVLISPLVINAGINHELREDPKENRHSWEEELPS